MSSHNKYRKDKEVSRAYLNSNEINNNHKKVVTSTIDYYSEWATEKSTVEKPQSQKNKDSAEPTSGNIYKTTNIEQYY